MGTDQRLFVRGNKIVVTGKERDREREREREKERGR